MFFSNFCVCVTNATVASAEHQFVVFFYVFVVFLLSSRNETLKGLSHNNGLLKMIIVVNPVQSFTEQDMSDDPIYPSPTGQRSKRYNTGARGSNLRSTGYNQSWAQEIFKSRKCLGFFFVFFILLLLFFFIIQLSVKGRLRPLPSFSVWSGPRVLRAPSGIKYKYCREPGDTGASEGLASEGAAGRRSPAASFAVHETDRAHICTKEPKGGFWLRDQKKGKRSVCVTKVVQRHNCTLEGAPRGVPDPWRSPPPPTPPLCC